MITDKNIEQWHRAVRDAHKKLGTPADSPALTAFKSGNKTGRFRDLQALTVVVNHLVAHGFAEPYLEGTGWFTKYGPILCRLWWDHQTDHIEIHVVARGVGERADNIDVAEYHIKFVEDKPVLEEKKFDVAALVLPQQG